MIPQARRYSPLDAAEMRDQLNSVFSSAQSCASEDDCVNRALGGARNPSDVTSLALTISNPPTAAEVQAVADQLDELFAVLKRP